MISGGQGVKFANSFFVAALYVASSRSVVRARMSMPAAPSVACLLLRRLLPQPVVANLSGTGLQEWVCRGCGGGLAPEAGVAKR